MPIKFSNNFVELLALNPRGSDSSLTHAAYNLVNKHLLFSTRVQTQV